MLSFRRLSPMLYGLFRKYSRIGFVGCPQVRPFSGRGKALPRLQIFAAAWRLSQEQGRPCLSDGLKRS